jgi:ABC-type branched-subunit amino acid transport system substrate-binding protein
VGDFSGATKATSIDEYNGLRAGVKYWNANGGFGGHQAQIATVDDNGEATTAVSGTLSYLSSHPKPLMVWAGAAGNETEAMIPLMEKESQLSFSVTDPQNVCLSDASINCAPYFNINAPADTLSNAAAVYFKHLGAKSVGILQESQAFTEGETPPLVSALKKLGVKATIVSYPATAVDVTAEMSELKSDGVDAVEAEGYGPAGGYILNARSQLGWKVPMVFDAAASTINLAALVNNSTELKGTYMEMLPPSDGCVVTKGISLMVKEAKAGGWVIDNSLLGVAAFAWDAAMALHGALITDHGNTNAQTLMKTLEHLPTAVQYNPLLTSSNRVVYSVNNHEQTGITTKTFLFVPTSPVIGGQVHPESC